MGVKAEVQNEALSSPRPIIVQVHINSGFKLWIEGYGYTECKSAREGEKALFAAFKGLIVKQLQNGKSVDGNLLAVDNCDRDGDGVALIFLGICCSSAVRNAMSLIQPSDPPCQVCSQSLSIYPDHNPNCRCNTSLLIDYCSSNGIHNYIIIDVGKTFREQVLRWFTFHKIPRIDSVHGNVCLASIVVTQTLDWKLHAFDVLSEYDGTNGTATRPMLQYEWLVGSQYKPMELAKSDWYTIRKSPPWAIDSWGLGCFIYEIFSGLKLVKT
ncbi:uncharacterized protein LOC111318460 [Durio zibethinus]|uniref:Uncharacterized protein LOC111318460 n=1 Tax=Durio zibethinus TaxID=66656 RepID=A0A6P6BIY4_DURZI|nr:uncharacterized protein LOC111318460 [Durio zibethinus]